MEKTAQEKYIKIICQHRLFYDDENESTHLYKYIGINTTEKSACDLVVPFEILKNKTYYLLVASFDLEYPDRTEYEKNSVIELYDQENLANSARLYIKGEIKPTQHEVLDLLKNEEGLDYDQILRKTSCFSINNMGKLCILKNVKWTGPFENFQDIEIINVRLV